MFKKLKDWASSFRFRIEAEKYTDTVKPTDPKSAKEIATARKEPWVAVLDTQVNPDNVRNGFFELDWNEYFIMQLQANGYQGTSEEEMVDQWFQDLCRNIGNEAGVEMENRGSGYVNRALRDDGKTEIG